MTFISDLKSFVNKNEEKLQNQNSANVMTFINKIFLCTKNQNKKSCKNASELMSRWPDRIMA